MNEMNPHDPQQPQDDRRQPQVDELQIPVAEEPSEVDKLPVTNESLSKKTEVADLAWREYHIHADDNRTGGNEPAATNSVSEELESNAFDLFNSTQNAEPQEISYQVLDVTTGQEVSIRLEYFEDYAQSTGVSIWQASETLFPYMCNMRDLFLGKQVLELGAGVGLCSLTAHYLGASNVLATDGDVAVLEFLRRNVDRNRKQHNAGAISCPQLIWGRQLPDFLKMYGPNDIVLAADICYMSKSIVPIFQTAHHLLKDNGLFILIHQAFTQEEDFHETVARVSENNGFTFTRPTDMPEVYSFPRGFKPA